VGEPPATLDRPDSEIEAAGRVEVERRPDVAESDRQAVTSWAEAPSRLGVPRPFGLYARHGWNVVINFSRDPAPAEAVAAVCRALGAVALCVKADVASDAGCKRLAAEIDACFGRADVRRCQSRRIMPACSRPTCFEASRSTRCCTRAASRT
jgi:hypothetical protein